MAKRTGQETTVTTPAQESNAADDSQQASDIVADMATDAAAPTLRSGFFYGLVGSAVREAGNGANRKILDYRFIATKPGVKKAILDIPNVEMPYPMTEAAAIEAAADYTYTKYRLVFEKEVPQYQAVELKGIVGAVALAKDRTVVETMRGRARDSKVDGATIRKQFAALFGFTAPGDEPPTVNVLSILTNPDATPEQKQAALLEELQRLAMAGKIKIS